jgi:type I restriction enzyme R subunit
MLLTGFDAPVEQVMYLDSPLREHTLLQAIARVNRTTEGKTYGLVVDYWGVTSHLQDALAVFDPDVLGEPMLPLDTVVQDVEMYHRAAIRFFARVNRDDLEACVRVLEPEDTRAHFDEQFRKFGRAMDQLMPDPRAVPYRDDLRWLGRIRLAAAARFRDDKIDIRDCGEKVRALIAEYIGAARIEQLLEPVSILSPKFDEEVEKLENADAKASEMEHAIKEELKIRYEENPIFYQTLRERLEQILAERRLERLSSAEELRRLRTLAQELRSVASIAESMGLTPVSFALYELLLQDTSEMSLKVAEERTPYHAIVDEPKRELASLLEEQLRALAVVDWRTKDDVQREMRRQVKRQLRASGFDSAQIESLTSAVIDIARRGLPA